MRYFTLALNPSPTGFSYEQPISVYLDSLDNLIGTCAIGNYNNIIGEFRLEKDIDDTKFIKYIFSNNETSSLIGILILDNVENENLMPIKKILMAGRE